MIIALRTQFHIERPWGQSTFSGGLLRDCTTLPINRFAALVVSQIILRCVTNAKWFIQPQLGPAPYVSITSIVIFPSYHYHLLQILNYHFSVELPIDVSNKRMVVTLCTDISYFLDPEWLYDCLVYLTLNIEIRSRKEQTEVVSSRLSAVANIVNEL